MNEASRKLLEEFNNKTPKEKEKIKKEQIEFYKEKISKLKLELKKWKPLKGNPMWSHDHCDFCKKHISNFKEHENEAYTDKNRSYWVCKACFKKYLAEKSK